jgi:hypothetical protein
MRRWSEAVVALALAARAAAPAMGRPETSAASLAGPGALDRARLGHLPTLLARGTPARAGRRLLDAALALEHALATAPSVSPGRTR